MRQKQTKHTPEQAPFTSNGADVRHHSTLTGGTSILPSDQTDQDPLTADGSHDNSHELSDHGYNINSMPIAVHKAYHELTVSLASPQHPPHVHTSDPITRLLSHTNMTAFDDHALECFRNADQRPPINLESLTELDMSRIINNPKLRNDVNFDRDLHFRPNLDGSKGKQKLQQAEEYWIALEVELFMYSLAQQDQVLTLEEARLLTEHQFPQRLPQVFMAVRDILKTLVPDYDQAIVTDRLDVEHIMQQIHMGVCDLIDLSNWLAKILKSHCAPMRDSLVDEMRREIHSGAFEGNLLALVHGLRHLMKILEAMKLDVANHQIKHMRPLLIDDTVNFLQRYNAHRMSVQKLDPTESRAWLHQAIEELRSIGMTPSPLEALTSALIRDLLQEEQSSLGPQTFYLDADRLRGLRGELRSLVNHAICQDIAKQMIGSRLRPHELTRTMGILHDSITAIVGNHVYFVDYLENIAVEIVRVVLMAENPNSASYDADLVAIAENKLGEELSTFSHTFRECADALHRRLVPKIQALVTECLNMKALPLQDRLLLSTTRPTLLPGCGAICEPVVNARLADSDPDDSVVRRFAHIVVLHWQVWADLVYLDKFDIELPNVDFTQRPGCRGGQSRTPAVSNTRTIPVAEAVYAPGRKWLPVSVTVTDVPDILPPTSASSPSSPNTGAKSAGGEQQSEERAASPSVDSEQQRQPA